MGTQITGGVDTHLEVHVAAALDDHGGLLGTASFATTPDGYRELAEWLGSFSDVALVGVEGTGSIATPSVSVYRTFGNDSVITACSSHLDVMPSTGR